MDRIAVIGLGRFGRRLATMLADAGADVMAVDRRREIIESIRDEVPLALCLDTTDEDALKAQGVNHVDVAVVGIGTDFESAVLTAAVLKQLKVKRVICRATSAVRARIFQRIGVDEVVNPENEAAERWRNRLMVPAILERTILAEGSSLIQLAAPKAFLGKTLGQLDVRRKYEVNVVGIRRTVEQTDDDGQTQSSPEVVTVASADTEVAAGDVLLIIGADSAIAHLPAE